ncbi:MAG TPA: Kazal-type serine protease inhibitor domain-containing protein, partial [Candidatus Nitrosotenuis sp.]|nr:Kazal-type serine protease inhibitor domain-containing protein [Candidatus Nitrosotenuis sp.]
MSLGFVPSSIFVILLLVSLFSFVHAETVHYPYEGLCAPGFVALGKICVLDDRCGPGTYAGKICTIDGKEQPYLKPLKQGYAGISASNVICEEGLNLIFKSHDGSPACVNPNSIAKLKERGWQADKPTLACTLEYSPVCGTDNKTYGNKCSLNSEHVAMKHVGECSSVPEPTSGVFKDAIEYAHTPPQIDPQKGYFVAEIADGIYWLVGSGYQTMFVTTGQGVIAVDAPQPIGEKYIQAIKETTNEPITHMIYSHSHQDHTGAAGKIFPPNITYIAQKETADILRQENDSNRPIPNVTFDDNYTLTVGRQTLELYHIGDFHSKGDILILAPKQKVAMAVDLFRPGMAPYRAFGVTPDIDLYLKTHDILIENFDFDVIISGHSNRLGTKDDIKINKQFTLDVMENARQALKMTGTNSTETCSKITKQQWEGKLADLDIFMAY